MRPIAILLYPGLQPLDVVGPNEVFAGANDAMESLGQRSERYQIDLFARTVEPVRGTSGLSLLPTKTFEQLDAEHIDTLIVPGGIGGRTNADPELLDSLTGWAARSRRIASVCTGTFLLASAGLCDDHRVTTHWAHAGTLARRFPAVTVDPDPIFINDGQLWTSAGVTAGIDLSLALVEADCGARVAQMVARHLVVYLRRPGGQSQFATPVWAEPTEVPAVRTACDLVHQHPERPWTVASLASRVGLSERHFTRVFRAEVGESPGRYLDRVRVEAARSILESESTGLDAIADRTGFGSAETLRRAFHRRLGISPAAYRRQLGAQP